MSAQRDFIGKVVIITGSSSGIGAVTAEEFAKARAQVVITGRNANNLSEVGKLCLKASPEALNPLEIIADIGKEDDCKKIIDLTIAKFGRLDILVNNAGKGAISSIQDPKILETFDELMNLNLRSVICLTHLSVEHLAKTKGNIVNISSVAGLTPRSAFGVYCITKCALDMFTKCTALELGPKGIRVNIVNPAAVRTNFGAAMGLDAITYDAFIEQRGNAYPLGRVGESIDIANVILFLASDQCSWITGTNFLADGGGLYAPGSTNPVNAQK